MGENTKIEWATRLLAGRPEIEPELMNDDVAIVAEGHAVCRVESKVMELSERSDVVGMKVASTIIPAMTTSESVTNEHVKAPAFQLSRCPEAAALDAPSVNVARVFRASDGNLPDLRADLRARFDRVLFPNSSLIPEAGSAKGRLSGLGVVASQEGRFAALRRNSNLDATARETGAFAAVMARSIVSKIRPRLPVLAAGAPTFVGCDALKVFVERHASFFGCNLQRAFWSLRHG